MFSTSPKSQLQKQKQTRTRITSSGWAWSSCSSLGGAINYADKAVLGSHRWQRIGDVLLLIQPDAPPESTMQRDMQWDVTCCPV